MRAVGASRRQVLGSVLAEAAITGLVTGLGVSIGSAFFPARRAAATPPVAAMRNVAVDGSSRSRTRVATGVGVTLLGAASLIGGLFAGVPTPWRSSASEP